MYLPDPRSAEADLDRATAKLKLELDEAYRLIALLVTQAGGDVTVTDDEIAGIPRIPQIDQIPGIRGETRLHVSLWPRPFPTA